MLERRTHNLNGINSNSYSYSGPKDADIFASCRHISFYLLRHTIVWPWWNTYWGKLVFQHLEVLSSEHKLQSLQNLSTQLFDEKNWGKCNASNLLVLAFEPSRSAMTVFAFRGHQPRISSELLHKMPQNQPKTIRKWLKNFKVQYFTCFISLDGMHSFLRFRFRETLPFPLLHLFFHFSIH